MDGTEQVLIYSCALRISTICTYSVAVSRGRSHRSDLAWSAMHPINIDGWMVIGLPRCDPQLGIVSNLSDR